MRIISYFQLLSAVGANHGGNLKKNILFSFLYHEISYLNRGVSTFYIHCAFRSVQQ